jgi:hypothetical protein
MTLFTVEMGSHPSAGMLLGCQAQKLAAITGIMPTGQQQPSACQALRQLETHAKPALPSCATASLAVDVALVDTETLFAASVTEDTNLQ